MRIWKKINKGQSLNNKQKLEDKISLVTKRNKPIIIIIIIIIIITIGT